MSMYTNVQQPLLHSLLLLQTTQPPISFPSLFAKSRTVDADAVGEWDSYALGSAIRSAFSQIFAQIHTAGKQEQILSSRTIYKLIFDRSKRLMNDYSLPLICRHRITNSSSSGGGSALTPWRNCRCNLPPINPSKEVKLSLFICTAAAAAAVRGDP